MRNCRSTTSNEDWDSFLPNPGQMKHHYLPQFYLKRWSRNNPDGKLASGKYCQTTNKFKWTRRAPSGTGYETNLYKEIEKSFFSPLDNDACNILSHLESGQAKDIYHPKLNLGEKDHERWATFILGFIIRMPNKVRFIQDGFQKKHLDESIAIDNIPNIIKNSRAIKDLRSLTWDLQRLMRI